MDTFAIVAGTAAIFWALTILAVVDVLLKDFGSTKTKAIWGFTALLPFVGWLIYLFIRIPQGGQKKMTPNPNND